MVLSLLFLRQSIRHTSSCSRNLFWQQDKLVTSDALYHIGTQARAERAWNVQIGKTVREGMERKSLTLRVMSVLRVRRAVAAMALSGVLIP